MIERRHGVVRTAQLEGSNRLETLGLQEVGAFGRSVRDQWGPQGDALESPGGFADLSEADEPFGRCRPVWSGWIGEEDPTCSCWTYRFPIVRDSKRSIG